MLLSRLAETRHALVATRSRNAKRDLIAAVLRDADADDVEIVVSYLSGSLRQRRTGVGWKSLQSVPTPGGRADAHRRRGRCGVRGDRRTGRRRIGRRPRRSGRGAVLPGDRPMSRTFCAGWCSATSARARLEAQVQDGLAVAFGVPVAGGPAGRDVAVLETAAAATLLAGGLPALEAVGLQVGVGVQPMLAASAPDPDAAVARSGLPALVDNKLDGIRVQVHRVRRRGADLHPESRRHHRPAAGGRHHRPGAAARSGWCWTARCCLCATTDGRRRSRWSRPAP